MTSHGIKILDLKQIFCKKKTIRYIESNKEYFDVSLVLRKTYISYFFTQLFFDYCLENMLAALIKNTDDDETEDERDALNNSLTAMDWLQQLNGKDVGQSSSDCENEDSNHEENNKPPYRFVNFA